MTIIPVSAVPGTSHDATPQTFYLAPHHFNLQPAANQQPLNFSIPVAASSAGGVVSTEVNAIEGDNTGNSDIIVVSSAEAQASLLKQEVVTEESGSAGAYTVIQSGSRDVMGGSMVAVGNVSDLAETGLPFTVRTVRGVEGGGEEGDGGQVAIQIIQNTHT